MKLISYERGDIRALFKIITSLIYLKFDILCPKILLQNAENARKLEEILPIFAIFREFSKNFHIFLYGRVDFYILLITLKIYRYDTTTF